MLLQRGTTADQWHAQKLVKTSSVQPSVWLVKPSSVQPSVWLVKASSVQPRPWLRLSQRVQSIRYRPHDAHRPKAHTMHA
eukprot:365865-Chlamydomonas_euryale.AAC.2